MERWGGFSFVQGDGGSGELLYEAAPMTGESEICLARYRFHGGAAVSGVSECHLLTVHLDHTTHLSCQIGKRRSDHLGIPGTIVICPADTVASGESDEHVDALYVALPKQPFALMAVEHARPNANFTGVLLGRDDKLLAIVRELSDRARVGAANEANAWRDLSAEIYEHIFETYLLGECAERPGVLNPDSLRRIYQYVGAHLAEPIEIDALADVVGKTRSHFPRLFRRSVGISPHQYVVRRRLQRAVQLICDGEMPLADVALETGFVDQSHLCRWTRRVYGISPSQAAAAQGQCSSSATIGETTGAIARRARATP